VCFTALAGHVRARAADQAEESPGRPVALAAADFDEDGIPDLVSGFASDAGGAVTLRLGNPDAIYPHTPTARARRRAGRAIASPFLPGARTIAIAASPDFLETGDFDADGHFDLIAAAAGGGAAVLRGDGAGSFAAAEPIALPGVVTALTVGDVNGPDGLADVVIAVTTRSGPRLLIFAGYKGAWRSSPALFDLPAPATAVATGAFDDEHAADIAVAAGHELVLVHGLGRGSRASRAGRSSPVERRVLPYAVGSMVAGDFTGDRRVDLAVASLDGAVHVLTSVRDNAGETSGRGELAATVDRWTVRPVAEGVAGARLVRARVSNRAADDLLVVNRADALVRPVTDDGGMVRQVAAIDAAAALPMRLDIDARDDLVLLRPGRAEPAIETTLAATTRIVVNTNDTGPGSLRQAILDANAGDGDDLITFDIPGPGPHVITPATPLPPVGPWEPVIIDATSEPDFAGTPVIEISGALVGNTGDGLWMATSGCVVRGLVINRFRHGLVFSPLDDGPSVEDCRAEGNYIGTDISGTIGFGNEIGVVLGPNNSRLGPARITLGGTAAAARNVISGNGTGLSMVVTGLNVVQGNFIGTDASGARALGNLGRGIFMIEVVFDQVGGANPGAGNVISANGDDGLWMADSGPESISANFIGTDASGAIALGNGGNGVEVRASQVTIADNVIAASAGVGLLGASTPSIDILRNRIGTNSGGTAALGNQGGGIDMTSLSQSIIGNLISGNGSYGVVLGAGGLAEENLIGTDRSGTLPLGNQGDGVQVRDVFQAIGGDGVGNVIAFNSGRGIMSLPIFTAVPILSNAIFSNGGLGIDQGDDGVSPNDACDVDDGTLNFPVLTAVTGTATATTIAGQLNSLPGHTFELQFFSSAEADSSGFGEGARLIGSATATTDAACNATFSVTLPVAVPANHFVTATSTTTEVETRQRLTSEFSNALRFVPETAEEAIRALIADVRTLVEEGSLGRLAGFVLTVKLKAALFFVEHDHPRAAAVQLRGFIVLVEFLVRAGHLDPAHGQALADSARAILAGLTTS
jgi:hypothetical protein